MKGHPMDSLLKKLETHFTSEERSELLRLVIITAPLLGEDPAAPKPVVAATSANFIAPMTPGPYVAGAYWKN